MQGIFSFDSECDRAVVSGPRSLDALWSHGVYGHPDCASVHSNAGTALCLPVGAHRPSPHSPNASAFPTRF